MTPPNGNGGGGICFPSIVTVALGAPGVPLICWADTGRATNIAAAVAGSNKAVYFSLCFVVCFSLLYRVPPGTEHAILLRDFQTRRSIRLLDLGRIKGQPSPPSSEAALNRRQDS